MIYQLTSTPTGFKLSIVGASGKLLKTVEEAGSHGPLATAYRELDKAGHATGSPPAPAPIEAMARVLYDWNNEIAARHRPTMTIPFDSLAEPTKDDLRELARRLRNAA